LTAPETESERNRRAHERLMGQDLEWLKSVRLQFGPSLSLVDLSAGGALVESSAALRPGSTAALTITGRGVVETATFRVLRCEVARVNGGIVYRGACVFDRKIALPDLRGKASAAAPRPDPPPAARVEEDPLARLAAGSAEFEEVVRLIRSAASRPHEGSMGAPLAALVTDIGAALRRGDVPGAVLDFIERRLGPTLSRLASEPGSTRPSAIDVPWIDPIEPPQPVDMPAPTRTVDAASSGHGWNKIVVRYLDGRMLKGFTQDFHPSRPHFHLSPSIAGVVQPPVLVPMPRLKAVFFVRDFEGDPGYIQRKSFVEPLPGRRIEITFLDDEVMVGATLGYRPDGTGFFMTPADPSGNNLRVFVLPGSIRHIAYL